MSDNGLDDVIRAIRQRPGMYIGELLPHLLVGELFVNVVDLYLRGLATTFTVKVDDEGWVTVGDDGPGLPFDQRCEDRDMSLAEAHLVLGHKTPTADGHLPHTHFMPTGVGMILVNALSEKLQVVSRRAGLEYVQEFGHGMPVSGPDVAPTSKAHGTEFRFRPDPEVFQNGVGADLIRLRGRLLEAVHLFPGLRVELQDERFHTRHGLREYVALFAKEEFLDQYSDVAHLRRQEDFCHLDFACCGQAREGVPLLVHSWANGIRTEARSSHVCGMLNAVAKAGLQPSVVALSVVLDSPRYDSPTKSVLVGDDVANLVEKMLTDHFREIGKISRDFEGSAE